MNEPKMPTFCAEHVESVDVTRFGDQRSRRICLACGGDAAVSAIDLYMRDLDAYRSLKAEYDRATPLIEKLEREIRDIS